MARLASREKVFDKAEINIARWLVVGSGSAVLALA
jgi:hypothetical protein